MTRWWTGICLYAAGTGLGWLGVYLAELRHPVGGLEPMAATFDAIPISALSYLLYLIGTLVLWWPRNAVRWDLRGLGFWRLVATVAVAGSIVAQTVRLWAAFF